MMEESDGFWAYTRSRSFKGPYFMIHSQVRFLSSHPDPTLKAYDVLIGSESLT